MSLDPNPPVDPIPTATTSDLSAFAGDVEMIAEFIAESREHLVAAEDRMLLLERNAHDTESIHDVFRSFHTIKGLAGFLELTTIQEVAHEVESLLDLARTRKLTMTPPLVDAIFEGMDYIRFEINRVERHLTEPDAPPAATSTALLLHLRDACNTAASLPEAASPPEAHSATHPGPGPHSFHRGTPSVPSAPPESGRPADVFSMRVETAKLDHLMNMVGEMVIAESLVTNNPHVTGIRDARLTSDLALLTRTTASVQRATTSMRMVPIGLQFQKTARLVRDLSRQVGKQIQLATSGEETELDKTIAEELSDPLLHMVRNSIDHGIETPEQRELSGKDPIALIRLSASHRAGQVVIEIADDGRGLNREKILSKAAERGLIATGALLSDAETFLLIFEPGFSTADSITGISGRGVGMDVVRRHVERLRGSIDIHSEAGRGTTFFLKLPLTLAIIDGLVIAVGNTRYVLPIFSIREIFTPTVAELSRSPLGAEMANHRGALLPIVRLHQRFDLQPRSRNLTDGVLIVSESHGERFCLFVDDLIGKQQVVLKSLGETFQDIAGLAGCAVLSDGRIGLILDTDGIYRHRPE